VDQLDSLKLETRGYFCLSTLASMFTLKSVSSEPAVAQIVSDRRSLHSKETLAEAL